MDNTLELLYQYLVGMPNPNLWEPETTHSPMLGHGFFCFCQGIRLGISLGLLTAED